MRACGRGRDEVRIGVMFGFLSFSSFDELHDHDACKACGLGFGTGRGFWLMDGVSFGNSTPFIDLAWEARNIHGGLPEEARLSYELNLTISTSALNPFLIVLVLIAPNWEM